MDKMKKPICFVLTTELTAKAFLLSHLRALSENYNVTVVTNTENSNFLLEEGIIAHVIPVNIHRNINLTSDVKVLLKLMIIFYKGKFLSVHSVTPKAGLLAMLASWFIRTPVRIHTFTGQVWVTKIGLKRVLLKYADRFIASLTTFSLIDSPSQRQFLLDEKVISAEKSGVFCKGSISGVDVTKFQPDSQSAKVLRDKYNIPNQAILLLFIGRLTVDKGVLDLASAFSQLENEHVHLLFVGPDEQGMQTEINKILVDKSKNVHFVGHTKTPELYMAMADVLCLPSYREGFGTVLIEAAAVGVPAVASRIYGILDAVIDLKTGLMHEPKNINALRLCLDTLIQDPDLRLRLGKQAKQRAVNDFDSRLVTGAWVSFYKNNIHSEDEPYAS